MADMKVILCGTFLKIRKRGGDLRRYIVAKETGDMFVTKYPAVESDVVNDRNGCLCGS